MSGPKNPDSLEFEKVSLDDARQVLDDAVKPAAGASRTALDGSQRRKPGTAGGAEMLRTAALQWILKLPPHVQPRHLQVRYPRIANRLAAEWDHVAACEVYLESLLTDKRGGRKGFPLAVAQEIAGLRDYYFRLHHKNLTPWDHVEAGR
jgi:hypothetical protein